MEKKVKPETKIRELQKRVKDLESLCDIAGVPLLIVHFPELAIKKLKSNLTKDDVKWAKEKIAEHKKLRKAR